MRCASCVSVAEFPAEINIHFSGPNTLDKPSILVFPKLLVCLDCGFSQFDLPESELYPLREGRAA